MKRGRFRVQFLAAALGPGTRRDDPIPAGRVRCAGPKRPPCCGQTASSRARTACYHVERRDTAQGQGPKPAAGQRECMQAAKQAGRNPVTPHGGSSPSAPTFGADHVQFVSLGNRVRLGLGYRRRRGNQHGDPVVLPRTDADSVRTIPPVVYPSPRSPGAARLRSSGVEHSPVERDVTGSKPVAVAGIGNPEARQHVCRVSKSPTVSHVTVSGPSPVRTGLRPRMRS